jgi:hypothetical protein
MIDAEAIQRNFLCMEILWLTTENSPLRYVYEIMGDYIPELQKQVMMTLNSVLNLCMVKNSNGLSFRMRTSDI